MIVYNYQLCMREMNIPIKISFFLLCAAFFVQFVSAETYTYTVTDKPDYTVYAVSNNFPIDIAIVVISLILIFIITKLLFKDIKERENHPINSSQPAYQRDFSYTPPEPSFIPTNSTPQFSSSTAAYQHYMAEIEKFAELRDSGLLTNEEFEAKKQQILGIKKPPSVSASPSQKESEQSTPPEKMISDDDEITNVLKMRYAKGEISLEEYQEMRNNLKK